MGQMHLFAMAGVQHWWRGGADFVLHPLIHSFHSEENNTTSWDKAKQA